MRAILIITFLSISVGSFAQTDSVGLQKSSLWSNLSLQGMYQSGNVFGTNKFLRGNNAESDRIDTYQAYSLKLSRQTTGTNLWEQLYKYPTWGVGIYAANFDNSKEVGIPVAVYGFLNAPFKRWHKWTLNYELGLGAAFNWNSFNPITNQYNLSIGAKRSFFIDAGVQLHYNLTNNWDLISGFSLSHFSNGALKKPNKGINTIAPAISLKYNFYDRPVFKKQAVPKYNDENEWLISVFGGAKNVVFDSVDVDVREKYEGINFATFGISTAYNRQIGYKSKIGVGMTVSYNGSVNAQVAVENNELDANDRPLGDKLQLSIHPSYELVINRISIILQPAFYLYRKKLKNQSSFFHQRIGLKYHITDSFFAGLTLRSYDFRVSDFIEWNVGYRIKWR
jgi:hypothetical protein